MCGALTERYAASQPNKGKSVFYHMLDIRNRQRCVLNTSSLVPPSMNARAERLTAPVVAEVLRNMRQCTSAMSVRCWVRKIDIAKY